MKPTFVILLLALALPFGSRVAIAVDAPRYVAVASYRNTPEMHETVGNRARAVLRAAKIESAAVGTRGMTISVPPDRASEALQLLAKTIKAESLQLSLLVSEGGRSVVVTPDSVLESKKSK